jgi:catechol 2,3-dioxygenase
MRVQSLGHVVLKVRDLNRSVPFYRDILGLKEVAKAGEKMVFFSFVDNHHDVALVETDQEALRAEENSPGLHHVAFKVGDSLDELQEAKNWLISKGIESYKTWDHVEIRLKFLLKPILLYGTKIQIWLLLLIHWIWFDKMTSFIKLIS